jgi:hypothetical protein
MPIIRFSWLGLLVSTMAYRCVDFPTLFGKILEYLAHFADINFWKCRLINIHNLNTLKLTRRDIFITIIPAFPLNSRVNEHNACMNSRWRPPLFRTHPNLLNQPLELFLKFCFTNYRIHIRNSWNLVQLVNIYRNSLKSVNWLQGFLHLGETLDSL